MNKFKVGDLVRVVYLREEDDEFFPIGTQFTITGASKTVYRRSDVSGDFCYGDEIELVEDTHNVVDQDLEDSIRRRYDVDYTPPENTPKKYNDNKPMMSLIRPEFSLGLAEALTYGYTKYGEERGDIQNYLKGEGFYYSTIIDSLKRHINAFESGVDIDEESNIHHLLLAAANLMFLHTYESSDKGIDDRIVLNKLTN